MIYELKRIRLRTLFKLSFIFYAILGCVFGLAFLAAGMLIGFLHNPPDFISFIRLPEALRGYLGILIIIASSLAYGLIGAAFISVGAIIYNVFSSWIGGVEFEITGSEEEE
ncbi:MAG: hypothetical protein ACE5OP_11455 [Candidatus Glassbacteria bacterium]